MSISAKGLVQDTAGLLRKGGVGTIVVSPPSKAHMDKFEVRVPLHTSKVFLLELSGVAQYFNLPVPQATGFSPGENVNKRSGHIEASYFYNKGNIMLMKDVLAAAFRGGRPEGFLAKAIEISARSLHS